MLSLQGGAMEVQVIQKVDGRVDRITGRIIKSRLRVVAYARVSTGSEEQLSSYRSQLKYYNEKISSNINWFFSGIYADEAISGTQDYKRSDFMRMIQDALDNKFDMIITKSISRFARNTLDTLKYVRLLKEKNIAILFEEENINTLEMAGELLLTVLSSVAQQESETISSHVKLGLKMKMERGELVGYNGAYGYGYDTEKKQLYIIPEQANIIKFIFEHYVKGIGCNGIARKLSEMKVKTPKGFDVWSDNTIRRIIKNPIYIGDVLMGKTYTTDPISHRRVRNMGEENKYYLKNHHEPIIEKTIFDKAQEILKKRSDVTETGRRLGNYSRKYAFSSRLFCGCCGSVLTRRNWAANSKNEKRVWHCMKSVKKGLSQCLYSKALGEEIIEKAFVDVYSLLCRDNKTIIMNFIEKVNKIADKYSNNSIIKEMNKKKNDLNNNMKKLIDLHLNDMIDEKMYLEKKELLDNKIEKIDKELEHLMINEEDEKNKEKGLNRIKELLLKTSEVMPEFDKDVFEILIKKIIVGTNEDPYKLIFVLKTGDEYKKDPIQRHKEILCENDYKEANTVLEFESYQRIITFEQLAVGKMKKIIDKINIQVVCDLPQFDV